MIRTLKASALVGTLVAFAASGLGAQTVGPASSNPTQFPPPPTPVFSIGQPPIWRQQISVQATAYTQEGGSGSTFSYGVFHSLNKPPADAFNPLLGIIGGTLEGSDAAVYSAAARCCAWTGSRRARRPYASASPHRSSSRSLDVLGRACRP
jgi:hypothetical protein